MCLCTCRTCSSCLKMLHFIHVMPSYFKEPEVKKPVEEKVLSVKVTELKEQPTRKGISCVFSV